MASTMEFPAIRGRMGSRTVYLAQLPLKLVPKMFKFTEWAEMPPEVRAQRKLVTKRVPEIARYLLDHEDDWVFSSLTASFGTEEKFKVSNLDSNLGLLELPLDTEFLINDGQHRRAAIDMALRENPTLGEQTISVVLLPEENLERNQQVFSDLNRTVQKTSRSLDILYDHRDPMNQVALAVAGAVPLFHGRVEKDTVSLAVKSPRFITLSALYDATVQFLGKVSEDEEEDAIAEKERQAITYWKAMTQAIPEWRQILAGDLKPTEARAEFVHSHAVAFWALGAAGKTLIAQHPEAWEGELKRLGEIDWRKTNPEWQGICMLGRDIITRRQTKDAMTRFIEWKLGVAAEPPDQVI
jgi:DNA sulfur modification protein DndB